MRLRDGYATAGIVLLVVLLFMASLAYASFQWTECRKDPDHTFWHCVAVLDS